MIRTFLIITILLMVGCGFTTTIKDPDGRVYEIVSQKDALVHAKLANGVDLTIDNRGPKSSLQTILDAWALKIMFREGDDK